jgi:alpha-L-fucosidase 2
MKNITFLVILFLTGGLLSAQDVTPDQTIWFNSPAVDWQSQSLPIGNGFFGASVFGGVQQERFDIAEKTFFSGGPHVTENFNYGIVQGGKENIAQIRKLILEKKYAEADVLCVAHLMGDMNGFGSFSTVGKLLLNFRNHDGDAADYRRTLDLANSLATVSYKINGTQYNREYFCSYPDKVMVCRLTADAKRKISFDIDHQRQYPAEEKVYTNHDNIHELAFIGTLKINGLGYCIRLAVQPQGGTVSYNEQDKTLSITDADEAVLYYTVATEYKADGENFKGNHPVAATAAVLTAAAKQGYAALKENHINDYKKLYDRVTFSLVGNPDMAKLPTNERFELLKNGTTDDSALKVLYFHLGRYLIISASRPGTLPSNLQGVWNSLKKAPWNGNFQSNINLQEMYWGCGPTNLPECQEAYIDYIERLVPFGRKVAESYYGTKGWTSHTIGNIWGYAAPGRKLKWGLYPIGATWHCQHVWSQYEYTGDKEYLKNRAYPILKEAAVFWLENLQDINGHLNSVPSVSAEHGIQLENGQIKKYTDNDAEPGDLNGKFIYTVPNFQDIEMIHDLFTNVIKASEILNTDNDFREKVLQARNQLEPLKIGKYGQLQEWLEDYDNARDHHRHIAHLYGVYPGEMISVHKTPELAAAAKVSLNMRDEGFITPIWPWTGGNWSMAWRVACWTRLQEGERAIKIFNQMCRETGFENLMNSQPFNRGTFRMQVDASMATPGLFAEMLLQKGDDTIYLLPALPMEWPEGEVKGLLAKGGYSVEMSWEYGQLKRAVITVPQGAVTPKVFVKGKPAEQGAVTFR